MGENVGTAPSQTAIFGVVAGLLFVGVVIAVGLIKRLSHTVHEVEAPFRHEVATPHPVDPVERLHAVHHATIADCDLRVEPVDGGFRAEASKMMTHEDIWSGPTRPTPDQAVVDAESMIDQLQHRGGRSGL